MAKNKTLLVFSGLDGAGKSTQIDLLQDYLKSRGKKPHYLWTRGGYTTGFNALKSLVRKSGGGNLPPSGRTEEREQALSRPIVQKVWLALAILDLIRVYGLQIRFWRILGKTVICDRYLEDTAIDFQLNFPGEPFEKSFLWKLLTWITPIPDVAFVLLISIEESLKRSVQKDEPFPDSVDVLAKRLASYKLLANQNDWILLNGEEPIETVWQQIQQAVEG